MHHAAVAAGCVPLPYHLLLQPIMLLLHRHRQHLRLHHPVACSNMLCLRALHRATAIQGAVAVQGATAKRCQKVLLECC
jgi:hypothetical protein